MNDDLGFDFSTALPWFPSTQFSGYTLVQVTATQAAAWSSELGLTVRRCYVGDNVVDKYSKEKGVSQDKIIATRLPDAGSTMSGDFGEVVVLIYQSASSLPDRAVGVKKWRLKQDRKKPAPHSDVVHFILPTWPQVSANDTLLCAEVKTKATDGSSTPVSSALEDIKKDQTSRLASTLSWLRERAMTDDQSDISIAQINRFIEAVEHPPAKKKFSAIAVVCTSVLDAEIKSAPSSPPDGCTLVIIAVPNLKKTYTEVFEAAKSAGVPVRVSVAAAK